MKRKWRKGSFLLLPENGAAEALVLELLGAAIII